MGHLYNGILLKNKKEGLKICTVIAMIFDALCKVKEADSKAYIIYYSVYMTFGKAKTIR